ncbi:MAG TPA: response regulator transcription factor [Tepidiformaceae bacterium]|nr:response regulator transcription factor [Tepidiformaceae bacterium]
MTTDPLILAVDDEAGILRLMKLELSAQGFRVITAGGGDDAIRLAEEQRPDAILLDVMMPEVTGLEVMRRIREHSNVPILLVTARDKDADKVRGLEMGADDYIVKPFSPDELGARVRAVLRRALGGDTERVVRAGDVEIDLMRRLVTRDGESVSVTRTEWLLLQHLAANAGKVMLNTELLTKVWGPEYRDDLQYLRVWISRLRGKLEETPSNPRIIKTLQGIGYLFEATPEAEAAQASS